MYDSPITQFMDNYVSDIQKQITEQKEAKIMQTISETMGFDIDKQELIKALNYDREQYNKGYEDARHDMLKIIDEIKSKIIDESNKCFLGMNWDKALGLDLARDIIEENIKEHENG